MMKLLTGRGTQSDKPEQKKREQKSASPESGGAQGASKKKQNAAFPSHAKTEVDSRLKLVMRDSPIKTGRGQDVVPLSQDFDRMKKHLRDFIDAARKYRGSMTTLSRSRNELFQKTKTLAGDTHLSEVVRSHSQEEVKELCESLDEKTSRYREKDSQRYQQMIIDYAVEWESIINKKVEEELEHAHKLHKNVQRYEDRVSNLRQKIVKKEENGNTPSSGLLEKTQKNENKLAKAWEEFDSVGTRTANLLEAVTKMGWKDLHPLVQTMVSFEQDRQREENALWECVGSIQDKLVEAVTSRKSDEPTTPASHEEDIEPTERSEEEKINEEEEENEDEAEEQEKEQEKEQGDKGDTKGKKKAKKEKEQK